MFDEQSKTYIIGEDSVQKALALFATAKKNTKRKKIDKDEGNSNKYSQYCNPIISNKINSTALYFLQSFALKEMRLCLMKHDWSNLQRLFLLLLQFPNKKETLIWRYALVILLHSPMSNEAHLKDFFNLCIGCQSDNYNYALNELITLKNDKTKR
ncbi:PREDICTED: uncharacterized protein LOC105363877 [Ceratosolen solmsi marchali]|uniref:Uncharacterized protein LOC105363877 n=1 Tax=Ceratosolen solmsi marchali TaxID=326594 RepID=A0AAJ7DXF4_9HYME|nr:PREDICTED: uncharacterized protein LOC105363877 [Ceratosolen solmsi marchali]